MAKGDDKRARNQIDYQGNVTQNNLNNLRSEIAPHQEAAFNNATNANTQAGEDYGSIMGQYRGFADSANAQGAPITGGFNPNQQNTFNPYTSQNVNPATADYSRSAEMGSAMRGYQGFADTGGFSGQDISDIRARGVSPIRAAYENANREVARNRSLQGGYAPNTNAVIAKMARESGQGMADANQNVNAQIAQMVQSGKLAGLSGSSNLAIADSEMMNRMMEANAGRAQQAGLANQQAGLSAANMNMSGNQANNALNSSNFFNNQNVDLNRGAQQLGAIEGQRGMYSATPGMANMFGDQLLNTTNQRLQGEQLQNNLGQGLINSQISAGQLPGTFDSTLGHIGGVFDIAGKVGGAVSPWLPQGKKIGGV